MTTPKLEAPETEDDLYLARGVDVPVGRPIATGDVFDNVPRSVGADDHDLAMVITHPCAMRSDGVNLVDRILVAAVRPAAEVPFDRWRGHFKKMPLPNLVPGVPHAALFLEIEAIESKTLNPVNRVAALQRYGVNLLMQRLVHHMSRVVVETDRFNVACAPAFAELDIVEDWVEMAVNAGINGHTAAIRCHNWMREADGSRLSPQSRLERPQERAAVRRDARVAAQRWIERTTASR